ncbi:MAG: aspartate carbamoyltransferase regulatory subunit [bacterium]
MTKDKRKEVRTISQIERGTVIDHLDPKAVFLVVRVLDIDENVEDTVTVGVNLKSKIMGKKGIIKIANRFLSEEIISKIAVISPNATVSIIDDYEVKEKIMVKFPEVIEGILKCPNPNCVTNVEEWPTRFKLIELDPLSLLCTYCERYMTKSEIELW